MHLGHRLLSNASCSLRLRTDRALHTAAGSAAAARQQLRNFQKVSRAQGCLSSTLQAAKNQQQHHSSWLKRVAAEMLRASSRHLNAASLLHPDAPHAACMS